MIELFLIISTLTVLFYLFQKNGYLTAPFLFACVCLGWLLPQIFTVGRNDPQLSDGLQIFSLMSALCLAAVVIAFELGRRDNISAREKMNARLAQSLDENAVAFIAMMLTVVALIMTWLVNDLRQDFNAGELWTGRITIIYFFQNVKMLSLFLSVCLVLKRPKSFYIGLFVANFLIYFPSLTIYFRRRAFLEFFFALALAFFFVRNKTFPRFIVVSGVLVASIGVFAIGSLRSVAYDKDLNRYTMPSFSELTEIDFMAYAPFISDVPSPEVRTGTVLVEVSNSETELSYGRQSWNRLVFQFIPAQIFGAAFKRSLSFEGVSPERLINKGGYQTGLGSTNTGIAEAFMEFSYLGCLFFGLFGWLMGLAWRYMSAGFVMGGAFYIIGIIPLTISPTAYPIYPVAYAAPQFALLFVVIFGYNLFRRKATEPVPYYGT